MFLCLFSRWPICLITEALCSLLSSWQFGVGGGCFCCVPFSSTLVLDQLSSSLHTNPPGIQVYLYNARASSLHSTPLNTLSFPAENSTQQTLCHENPGDLHSVKQLPGHVSATERLHLQVQSCPDVISQIGIISPEGACLMSRQVCRLKASHGYSFCR